MESFKGSITSVTVILYAFQMRKDRERVSEYVNVFFSTFLLSLLPLYCFIDFSCCNLIKIYKC